MGIFWPAPGPSNAEFASLQDGLAIVADGNTHIAITSGQYVYVKNHDTLSDGLYKASSNIAANATLSSSNLTADSKGGLNDIADQIANIFALVQNISISPNSYTDVDYPTGYSQYHTMVVGVLIANIYHDYTNINVILNESKIRVYNNSSQTWQGVKILLTKI